MPLISMDAAQAARQIIAALCKGDAEAILSAPAQLLTRFHGLFPSATAGLAGLLAALLLPSAHGGTRQAQPGHAIERNLAPLRPQVLNVLASPGRRAAQRYQQHSSYE